MDQEQLRSQAAALLMQVWRGMGNDFKSKYRRTIWQQFEDEIRSAAYTNNLGKFINSLCSRLDATVGTNEEGRAEAEQILNAGQDRALLKLMREETTLLVLMVRVANQERKAEFEALEGLDN